MTKNFQTIVFARKHSLVHKTGEANATILVFFPPNNSVLLPGKDLHREGKIAYLI